jgi:hypothetical protein
VREILILAATAGTEVRAARLHRDERLAHSACPM